MSTISTARIVDINNAISSYSTVQGRIVNINNFSSILSTQNYAFRFNTGTLNTSSLQVLGQRQPFIQYGTEILSADGGNVVIGLSTNYINSNYAIQLTYRNDTNIINVSPLSFTNVTTSNFTIYGDKNGLIHWTTFGDLF
jgi:hypothetical protein